MKTSRTINKVIQGDEIRFYTTPTTERFGYKEQVYLLHAMSFGDLTVGFQDRDRTFNVECDFVLPYRVILALNSELPDNNYNVNTLLPRELLRDERDYLTSTVPGAFHPLKLVVHLLAVYCRANKNANLAEALRRLRDSRHDAATPLMARLERLCEKHQLPVLPLSAPAVEEDDTVISVVRYIGDGHYQVLSESYRVDDLVDAVVIGYRGVETLGTTMDLVIPITLTAEDKHELGNVSYRPNHTLEWLPHESPNSETRLVALLESSIDAASRLLCDTTFTVEQKRNTVMDYFTTTPKGKAFLAYFLQSREIFL